MLEVECEIGARIGLEDDRDPESDIMMEPKCGR